MLAFKLEETKSTNSKVSIQQLDKLELLVPLHMWNTPHICTNHLHIFKVEIQEDEYIR